ncbi:hypothetical protein Leryth_018547 [Lithospermum erythrorhizon]|nr:hypothetical protein Leryth_018547 [Lithospermum erythrorhizon]
MELLIPKVENTSGFTSRKWIPAAGGFSCDLVLMTFELYCKTINFGYKRHRPKLKK